MRKGRRHNGRDFFNRIAIGFPRTAILREVMNWKDSGPKSARRLLPWTWVVQFIQRKCKDMQVDYTLDSNPNVFGCKWQTNCYLSVAVFPFALEPRPVWPLFHTAFLTYNSGCFSLIENRFLSYTIYPVYSFPSPTPPTFSPTPLPSRSTPFLLSLEKNRLVKITTKHNKIKCNKIKQNFHYEFGHSNPTGVPRVTTRVWDPLNLTVRSPIKVKY